MSSQVSHECVSTKMHECENKSFCGLRLRDGDEVSGNNRTASRLMGKGKKRPTSLTICEKEKQEKVCKDETNRNSLPLQTV